MPSSSHPNKFTRISKDQHHTYVPCQPKNMYIYIYINQHKSTRVDANLKPNKLRLRESNIDMARYLQFVALPSEHQLISFSDAIDTLYICSC